MAEAGARARDWWGSFELELGVTARWRVGPLDLWVLRTDLDWRYGAARGDDVLENTLEVCVPVAQGEAAAGLPDEQGRFGFGATDATLEIVPALADRPVVARPSVPFFIPPGETIELFVSTPLWARLRSKGTDLIEVPCTRPSDTWFGDNTRGQLAYSTRTHLRRNLDDLPLRPHRAVSCVQLKNRAAGSLALESLALPVPQLSLYASESGVLWTERILLRNEEDGDLAEVALGEGPPPTAGQAELVAPPRSPQGSSFASLVFGGLFEARY